MNREKVLLLLLFYYVSYGSSAERQRRNDDDSIPCHLDDIQQTQGVCKNIRDCSLAISNLRANVYPKKCPESKSLFCCPIEPTFSEKKCSEWQSYLRTPKVGFSSIPLKEPACTIDHITPLIVGGRDALIYEFPHAVALGYGKEPFIDYLCGGTLIDRRYVLTAAHCLSNNAGKATFALLGDITLKHETAGFSRQLIRISEHILHPAYKPPLKYHDIALFKLERDVELSRYLYPACLPYPQPKNLGPNFEAVGWGLKGVGEQQSDILQGVNLTAFNTKDCDSYFSDSPDRSLTIPNGIIKSQLCAGDADDTGKDTCNGDSGGPLTARGKIFCTFHVVGLTSFGSRFCGYGAPGVYTKIQSYLDWIESTVWGDQSFDI